MSENPILQQAIDLVKSGDKKSAATLLSELVAREPENEEAWLWLATCAESDNDRAFYLQQALTINPGNQAARDTLVTLGWNPPPIPKTQPVETLPAAQSAVESSESSAFGAHESVEQAAEKPHGWIIAAIALGVIVLVGAGLFIVSPHLLSALFGNIGNLSGGVKASPTGQAEGIFPPTWTPAPAASPLPTNTRRPTSTAFPTPTQYIMPTIDMTVVWMNAFASATADTLNTAAAALNTPVPGVEQVVPNQNATPQPLEIACFADATSAHVTLTRGGTLVPFEGMNAYWISPTDSHVVRCNSPSNPTGEGVCSWGNSPVYTSGITLNAQVIVDGDLMSCSSK
jgi:hypothetical protein